jgi:hypothetical protein
MIDFDTQVLVQREGACCRTADQLASVFIEDAWDITKKRPGVESITDDPEVPDYVKEAMLDADTNGWCEDPDNGQVLSDYIPVVEGWLSDANMMVHWDDGFVILNTMMWEDEDWTETENW